MVTKNNRYINDFIKSINLPSLLVSEEELNELLSSPIEVEVCTALRGEPFVRYPNLFGDKLGKIWFKASIVKQISNKQLLALQYLMNIDIHDDPRSWDEIFVPKEFFVIGLSDTTSAYPLKGRDDSLGIILPR